MADINKLLRKRKFSPSEVGILLVTNMAVTRKKENDGAADPKPLISRARLEEIITRNITTTEDAAVFNVYVELHNWLTRMEFVVEAYTMELRYELERFVADCASYFLKSGSTATWAELHKQFLDDDRYTAIVEPYRSITAWNIELEEIADLYDVPDIVTTFARELEYTAAAAKRIEDIALFAPVKENDREGFDSLLTWFDTSTYYFPTTIRELAREIAFDGNAFNDKDIRLACLLIDCNEMG